MAPYQCVTNVTIYYWNSEQMVTSWNINFFFTAIILMHYLTSFAQNYFIKEKMYHNLINKYK